jgi:hypothetical protein
MPPRARRDNHNSTVSSIGRAEGASGRHDGEGEGGGGSPVNRVGHCQAIQCVIPEEREGHRACTAHSIFKNERDTARALLTMSEEGGRDGGTDRLGGGA